MIMMRFVDVKNDIAFRKIFGNEKKTGNIWEKKKKRKSLYLF